MNAVGAGALALAVCAGAAGCGADELSQPELIEKVKRSTVRLTGKYADGRSGGTGVVIDAKRGQVLTNAHVVAGLTSLRAQIEGSPPTAARIDAQAPCEDLAIVTLRPPPDDLEELKLAGPNAVKSGEHVTAVGYPASLNERPSEKAVSTEGSVSAVDIQGEPSDDLPRYPSLIQHQAPLNPGNSGGPLVNDKGELVGINTLRSVADKPGQFFAITSSYAKKIIPTLKAGEDIDYVGWNIVPGSLLVKYGRYKKPQTGMYVLGDPDTGSAADRAKFGDGDFVDFIEGRRTKSFQDVCDVVQTKGHGDEMKVRGEEPDRRGRYFDYSINVKVRTADGR
jgi:S1-C subfamily serine protease